eukprot:1147336-Pleurochrysis_carterae.AAC.1
MGGSAGLPSERRKAKGFEVPLCGRSFSALGLKGRGQRGTSTSTDDVRGRESRMLIYALCSILSWCCACMSASAVSRGFPGDVT